jgi:hypothetical protein
MERLEFLGDAVLKWGCTAHLVASMGEVNEGQLHAAKVGGLGPGFGGGGQGGGVAKGRRGARAGRVCGGPGCEPRASEFACPRLPWLLGSAAPACVAAPAS